MIGKVTRGARVGGLLRYLYGPGKANEHTDPHLVAAWDTGVAEPLDQGGGRWDVTALAALLEAPVHALGAAADDRPVWHCSLRTAPGDRTLTDAEWAQVARDTVAAVGLARPGDADGCRWVAVRHAEDHVHLVVTLARQDGTRPRLWRDYHRVREACRAAEQRLGLTTTAPADGTAASAPARAETEKAARRGVEVPRRALQRQVRAAAVAAVDEGDFVERLRGDGLVVRLRHGQEGDVTGYAVGVPGDLTRDGGQVLHGGAKLAADLSLPRLRARWTPAEEPPAAAPAVREAAGEEPHLLRERRGRAGLEAATRAAAAGTADEAEFLRRLDEAGLVVRLRHGLAGDVTGYAVGHPDDVDAAGQPVLHGGAKLAADLSLPRLRARWARGVPGAPAVPEQRPPVDDVATAARRATTVASAEAGRLRAGAVDDATAAGAGDLAAALARAMEGRRPGPWGDVARTYDRAARAPRGTPRGRAGRSDLQVAAHALARAGRAGRGDAAAVAELAGALVLLAAAVADLRARQDRTHQAVAARAAADRAGVLVGPAPVPRPAAPSRAVTPPPRGTRPRHRPRGDDRGPRAGPPPAGAARRAEPPRSGQPADLQPGADRRADQASPPGRRPRRRPRPTERRPASAQAGPRSGARAAARRAPGHRPRPLRGGLGRGPPR